MKYDHFEYNIVAWLMNRFIGLIQPPKNKKAPCGAFVFWRRERDSNPRRVFTLAGFQVLRELF